MVITIIGFLAEATAPHNADDMARSIGRPATKGDDAMRGAARGMMNLIDDPAYCQWPVGVIMFWDGQQFGDNIRVSDFDKLRQRLMSSGDELATATHIMVTTSVQNMGQSYNGRMNS